MPSVFADVRGKSVRDWIDDHTAGATFCRKSEEDELQGGELNLLHDRSIPFE